MIKLIPGKKGSGKTKRLIAAIHEAVFASKGNVVAIQLGSSLNVDINHKVRLINIEDYHVSGYSDLYGFIAGILASDYDCTHIFVDGLLRIAGRDYDEVGKLLGRISDISDDAHISFTISADEADLPPSVRKYF